MIEFEILGDIRKYESKIIGPFTMREALGIVVCAIVDLILYQILYVKIHLTVSAWISVIGIVDFVIMALFAFKIMGMIPMEQYVSDLFYYHFVCPKYRKLKNGEEWDELLPIEEKKKKEKKETISSAELKDHPEYIAYD